MSHSVGASYISSVIIIINFNCNTTTAVTATTAAALQPLLTRVDSLDEDGEETPVFPQRDFSALHGVGTKIGVGLDQRDDDPLSVLAERDVGLVNERCESVRPQLLPHFHLPSLVGATLSPFVLVKC